MRNGRPLRFLAVTLGGWTMLRVAMLWPDTLPVPLPSPAAASPFARAAAPSEPLRMLAVQHGPRGALSSQPAAAAPFRTVKAIEGMEMADPKPVAMALDGLLRFGEAEPAQAAGDGIIPPPLRLAPIAAAPSRLAASAWLVARGGSNGTLLGGQLGGSQAGLRLTYALDHARRVALAARLATPLAGRGREAAVGVEWQPTRAPVRLVAEQRIALDCGKGGPTLMAIGGIGPTPVGAGFRLESYAQAGAIARGGIEAFADGAARFTHPLATLGGATLDLGAGTWGAAQRGAARLDVGPSFGLAVPVAQRAIRLTLDYRQRVAGRARPGSGVALSIGSDF